MRIDLRSDTVTRPSAGMLDAMIAAHVGDDVYKEDPTVNALEEKIADLFGMDQALYFPTGSMTNQAAIKMHTQPGEQLIADKYAHVFNYEGGGVSFNSGVSCKLVDGHRGMITAEQVKENINPPDFYHSPLTSLVCLENTTNKGGGTCYDFGEILEIKKVCDDHNLGLHLDGACLWNALLTTDESPKDYGRVFDTISICLSKGLGAPMGSVLVGKKKYMDKAMRVRKVLGGGMRQVGFMAAAGIYAIDNHWQKMHDDHTRAKELAAALAGHAKVKAVEPVETNILIFSLNDDVKETDFMAKLKANDIHISSMGQGKLRIVTHYDYTAAMHDKFLEFLS